MYTQQRETLNGPALVRILAHLTGVDVSTSAQPLSDRSSQWLSWTDVTTPSSALSAALLADTSSTQSGGPDAETVATRIRAVLAKFVAFGRASDARPGPHASIQGPLVPVVVDYTDLRQCYVLVQQTMEFGIGELRGRLRCLLAVRTPDLARFAVLDASVEQALAGRECSLLGVIPAVLARYFERLHTAEQRRQAELPVEGQATPFTSRAWLNTFRKDMQSILLAELDICFQPVSGLLVVLRPR